MKLSFRRKTILITVFLTVMTGALALYVRVISYQPALLTIYIFNLSSGHSMFIRTPHDKRFLIDGGGSGDIIRELTDILPFYSRRIDAVIATDDDGKNVTGLVDVIKRYSVAKAYVPAFTLSALGLASSSDQIYDTFIAELGLLNLPTIKLAKNDSIDLDSNVKLKVFFPAPASEFSYSKASSPEMIFQISYGDSRITFLGNSSKKVQNFIADSIDSSVSITNADCKTCLMVVYNSAKPNYISPQIVGSIKPDYLIYESSPRNVSAKKTSTKSSKPVIDPLQYITDNKRFNLKEKGTALVRADEKKIEILDEPSLLERLESAVFLNGP